MRMPVRPRPKMPGGRPVLPATQALVDSDEYVHAHLIERVPRLPRSCGQSGDVPLSPPKNYNAPQAKPRRPILRICEWFSVVWALRFPPQRGFCEFANVFGCSELTPYPPHQPENRSQIRKNPLHVVRRAHRKSFAYSQKPPSLTQGFGVYDVGGARSPPRSFPLLLRQSQDVTAVLQILYARPHPFHGPERALHPLEGVPRLE